MYFRNYGPWNTWLDQSLKSPVSRDHSERNMVNAPKNSWNMPGSTFAIFLSLWRQLTYKKSLLLTCEISRLFPNTLGADCKYSLLNRDNLTQPIQMQVSQKQKTFSEFFAPILKSNLNFKHFQKRKHEPHTWCISEFTDPEKPG